MSVINKVLRDLDQRQSGRRAGDVADGASVVGQGVASPSGSRSARWALGGVLIVAALALGGYLVWTTASKRHIEAPVVRPQPGASQVESAAPQVMALSSREQLPMAVSAVTADAPAVQNVPVRAMPAPVKAPPAAVQERAIAPALAIAPKTAQPVKPTTAPSAEPAATAQIVAPLPVAALPPAVAVSAEDPALQGATAPRAIQQAAQEALAQAQTLWQQGNQAGAVELVRGVIARLQHGAQGQTDMLAVAAREYVRMALAQQRAPDALAMLVQLETPLAKVADIWALRGNVAQRMGLHAQAVHAYLNALELAPGQARWMLAAAVSLAAQGQKAPAADLAEKARRAGFLPLDVANYLHQLGVELRAP